MTLFYYYSTAAGTPLSEILTQVKTSKLSKNHVASQIQIKSVSVKKNSKNDNDNNNITKIDIFKIIDIMLTDSAVNLSLSLMNSATRALLISDLASTELDISMPEYQELVQLKIKIVTDVLTVENVVKNTENEALIILLTKF